MAEEAVPDGERPVALVFHQVGVGDTMQLGVVAYVDSFSFDRDVEPVAKSVESGC
jgi:hypothetical protein